MSRILITHEEIAYAEKACELVSEQLGIECIPAVTAESVQKLPENHYDVVFPLVLKPIALSQLLQEITLQLQGQKNSNDFMELGRGVMLSQRGKYIQNPATNTKEDITDKEMALILCLIASPTVSREELLQKVWGMRSEIDTHTLETHIYRLRNKLKSLLDAPWIVAQDGGYRLEL